LLIRAPQPDLKTISQSVFEVARLPASLQRGIHPDGDDRRGHDCKNPTARLRWARLFWAIPHPVKF